MEINASPAFPDTKIWINGIEKGMTPLHIYDVHGVNFKITAKQAENEINLNLFINQDLKLEIEADFNLGNFKILNIHKLPFHPITNKPIKIKNYHRVINIKKNDWLNIRKKAGWAYEIVGKIPPTGRCIKYLGKIEYIFKKNDNIGGDWYFIEFGGIQGWVNSYFLREDTCY